MSAFFSGYSKNSQVTQNDALKYGTAICLITIFSGIGLLHYFYFGFYYGTRVRVAVTSLIYRKVFKETYTLFINYNFIFRTIHNKFFFFQSLQLSQSAMSETAPGKLANLLSNDVSRFEIVSVVLHPLWTSPLMTIVATYILWCQTRWSGMIGLMIVFLIVPLQSNCEFFHNNFCMNILFIRI